MNKMITAIALVLALASPVMAKNVQVHGSTSTGTNGQTSAAGRQHGNAVSFGGSLVGAQAGASVGGGGGVNAKGKVTGSVGGQLSAGSTSVSVSGAGVLGNGSAFNTTAGTSAAGASLNVGIH
jgi:hypothetical protein